MLVMLPTKIKMSQPFANFFRGRGQIIFGTEQSRRSILSLLEVSSAVPLMSFPQCERGVGENRG
jgi:hypothetical protein